MKDKKKATTTASGKYTTVKKPKSGYTKKEMVKPLPTELSKPKKKIKKK